MEIKMSTRMQWPVVTHSLGMELSARTSPPPFPGKAEILPFFLSGFSRRPRGYEGHADCVP